MQIDRLFQIVYILMDRKQVTAKYLAEKFEVSTRTIYRDIDTLSLAGIPVYATKGKGGGISIMEHYIIDRFLFTDEEKDKLLMGLQTMQLTNLEEVDHALGKLKSVFHAKDTDWIKVDFSHWGNDPKERKKFDDIKSAIMNRRKTSFYYYDSVGNKTSRTVQPHQLLFKDKAWYLIAFCEERHAFRTFKVIRMDEFRVLDDLFERKALPEYLESVGGNMNAQNIELKLLVGNKMTYRVFEELGGNITKRTEEGFYIDYIMSEDESIYDYLMSFGEHLEILSPQRAREKMAAKINVLANKYSI